LRFGILPSTPLLVLANKQDRENAMTNAEIFRELQIDQLAKDLPPGRVKWNYEFERRTWNQLAKDLPPGRVKFKSILRICRQVGLSLRGFAAR
jgi:hypothetical protein